MKGEIHELDMDEEPSMSAEELEIEEQRKIDILDALGMRLAKTRSEAINGREQSKIENEWLEDEEHYEGIDDMNRGEISAWRGKPLGQAALRSDDDTGSTVFVNITGPYCDAAAAKLGDMLLPTDDRGWAIDPTPIPEMIDIAKGKFPVRVEKQIDEAFPDEPDKAQQTKDDLVAEQKELNAEAKSKADAAQLRIDDWMNESNYQPENRLVIEDAAKLGTGVLKGPIPERKKMVAFIDGSLVIKEEVKPCSRRVDTWNCFPDPGCGEYIHNGSYHWERDDITSKSLQELRGGSYIDSQINLALKEGAMRATRDFKEGDGRTDRLGLIERDTKNLFEIWYYYGLIEKEDMEVAGCECEDEQDSIYALITTVNNRVIKAAMNPLDTGDFPYDYMVWKRRSGSPFGIGVSRQLRTPQRIINGAMRNMMDNAGIAGGPMWIFNSGLVEPIDGIYEIAPRKGWMASEDAEIDDIQKAFTYITMDMMQEPLERIVMLGMKMAEDVTGLPMLLQGQQGAAPDTVGGMQMLNNNASTVMRRIVRLYDDNVTEKHVHRYYRYLLQHGDDAEKGEFVIDARGSSALIERDIQNQNVGEMAMIVKDPTFGLDPKKWMKEFLKSQRLDPLQFEYDDEEWEKIVAQMAEPPEDGSKAMAEMRMQADQMKLEAMTQIKMQEMQMKASEADKSRQLQVMLKQFDQQMGELSLSGADKIAADKIRASLAEKVMTLNTQRELSGAKASATQVAKPAAEPAGRAPNGQAFQK